MAKDQSPVYLKDLPDWAVVEGSLGRHSKGRCPECRWNRGCVVWAAWYLLTMGKTLGPTVHLYRWEVNLD